MTGRTGRGLELEGLAYVDLCLNLRLASPLGRGRGRSQAGRSSPLFPSSPRVRGIFLCIHPMRVDSIITAVPALTIFIVRSTRHCDDRLSDVQMSYSFHPLLSGVCLQCEKWRQ